MSIADLLKGGGPVQHDSAGNAEGCAYQQSSEGILHGVRVAGQLQDVTVVISPMSLPCLVDDR